MKDGLRCQTEGSQGSLIFVILSGVVDSCLENYDQTNSFGTSCNCPSVHPSIYYVSVYLFLSNQSRVWFVCLNGRFVPHGP